MKSIPAAITATITLALEESAAPPGVPLGTLFAVLVAAIGVLVILLAAGSLSTALSRRGIRIFERFSGLILIAIGFQMGMSGIREFFL